MQEVPASLSEFAERELRGRGIEVRTDTTLRELSATRGDALGRRDDPGADASCGPPGSSPAR